MINFLSGIRKRAVATWRFLSQIPAGFFGPVSPTAVRSPGEALTLSPFWAALRLYQSSVASLPLITYRRLDAGGRQRADTLPVYGLLKESPNPAQTRHTFFEWVVKEIFLGKGCFIHVLKDSNGFLKGLYPIPSGNVIRIVLDQNWNKSYEVAIDGKREIYQGDEIAHIHLFSLDGVNGVSLIDYAGEALGLHRESQRSAGSYYANALRPSGYVKLPGRMSDEAIADLKKHFKEEYSGADNRGKVPVLTNGASLESLPNTNATDAAIIEVLGASVADVARWFSLSPLLLGDLSRGTYSNLAADNTAFYQRSLRPLLDKIESELNLKIFGLNSRLYCEFLTQDILRGDPLQQAQVASMGIRDGWFLRSEQRDMQNLPPIEGLDVPLTPLNMGPSPGNSNDPTANGNGTAGTASADPGNPVTA